ncbi:MAG: hypothetical protein IPK12_13920 [Gemmatimonadetes bacterium]|nr:hypothetical protein [Gemmatimonadota bacterium]
MTAAPADDSRARRTGLDALRGLVMVIMALDHVRDFIHHDAMLRQPEDLATTTPLLFFTRWVTHLVAPTFSLAAGIGAYLWWRRGRTRGELSRFLATRGLWLVVLEVTVMRLAYNFTPSLQYPLLLLVLWVLGLSMLVLAALVWLPACAGGAEPRRDRAPQPARRDPRRRPRRRRAAVELPAPARGVPGGRTAGDHRLPAHPVGVRDGARLRGRHAVRVAGRRPGAAPGAVGLAMIAAFVVLRALNLYGDPAPWSRQDSTVFTLLSFLKTTKYPPSLLFLLMTLGPACLLLAAFERARLAPGHPLVIFGRVPPSTSWCTSRWRTWRRCCSGWRATGARRGAGLSCRSPPWAAPPTASRRTSAGPRRGVPSGLAWWWRSTRSAAGSRRSRRDGGTGGCPTL